MSEYDKLKQKGMGRGRPRHTEEQRAEAQEKNALRQEARRRAHLVLKNRHEQEFSNIYEMELKSLLSEHGVKKRSKSTRK
jgi:hypothetical protein